MTERPSMIRIAVHVRTERGWQPATYECGEFVDIYGLPLDRRLITGWVPAGAREESVRPVDAMP